MVRLLKTSPFNPTILVIFTYFIFQELPFSTVYGYTIHDFPPNFVFGAGSSAFQMEGAAFEDGRTPSILDTYNNPGNVYFMERACDQYHKYKEDVKLMLDMGLPAYKLSISWSRLIPNGRGPVNPKAVEHYNNLINELVNNGIQPHVVLLHMDTPQALEDDYGSWLDQQIVKDFTTYADVCFREFGDRVLHWTTFNEPNIALLTGYDQGIIPPKRCSPPFGSCTRGNSTIEPYIAVHNTLLAHATVVDLYRKKYQEKQHGYIGINVFANWLIPETDTKEDILATHISSKFLVGWILDPLVFGDYPDIMKERAGSQLPSFTKYQSRLVKQSFDFIALNSYGTLVVKDDPSILLIQPRDVAADSGAGSHYGGHNEEALEHVLEFFKQEYGNPPIYIHESGYRMYHNSSLFDKPRVEFLNASIGSVLNAARNGSNVRGYFVWSLIDTLDMAGFEDWAFGLYYMDYRDPDLRRYPKFSAYWYTAFLKGRSFPYDGDFIEKFRNSTNVLEPLDYS
ncbi:beta-glucosidase 11-like [Chenopodium quinoa]|uniref:beta-glucosidase 11-like n=1 Tax=Chenopodium quinoa TaxID=63459 RepID=UPI000B77CB06|nr:beta-glucosidase 11-like [Chenopodium quinoa]